MRLARPKSKMVGEPVIALVDVVFFLLVFFLLVARYDATAPFEVVPPVAITGEDMPAGGVTVSVAVDGEIAVEGTGAGSEWLAETARLVAVKNTDLIRINAHKDTALRHVLPLITALEEARLGQVVLVVTPAAEN